MFVSTFTVCDNVGVGGPGKLWSYGLKASNNWKAKKVCCITFALTLEPSEEWFVESMSIERPFNENHVVSTWGELCKELPSICVPAWTINIHYILQAFANANLWCDEKVNVDNLRTTEIKTISIFHRKVRMMNYYGFRFRFLWRESVRLFYYLCLKYFLFPFFKN